MAFILFCLSLQMKAIIEMSIAQVALSLNQKQKKNYESKQTLDHFGVI